MDITQLVHGLKEDTKDNRDFRSEIVMKAIQLPDTFSLRNKIFWVKNQGSSGSCTAQATSSYAEVLHEQMTGEQMKLSARDLYSATFLPGGGSAVRDAMKWLSEQGICLETDVSSYEQGKPPTEIFMQVSSDITEPDRYRALEFLAKSYVRIPENDFESVRQSIFQNNGVVFGVYGDNPSWQSSYPQLPTNKDWAHLLYGIGFATKDGIDYIECLNSWGNWADDGGYVWIPRAYFEDPRGLIINPWSLMEFDPKDYSIFQHRLLLIKELIIKIANQILQLKQ